VADYILKFGGSSLGRPERLARALGLIRREHALHPVELVVSAFGDTTDDLIAAAHAAAEHRLEAALPRVDRLVNEALRVAREAAGDPLAAATAAVAALDAELRELLGGIAVVGDLSPVTRDAILSFGERISSQLVAAALTAKGLPAVAVDARDLDGHRRPPRGRDGHLGAHRGRAARADAETTALRVHTGFLGRTVAGRTTTLGRNGSDYTAALLARARQAKELHVWTDVSGVMTADPCLVDEAYPVTRLSYREALELAGLGLRMLHPRTVLPLLASGIPMRIRSTLAPDAPGTRVGAEGSTDIDRPTCVTSLEDMTLLDVEGTQATASAQIGPRTSTALAAAGVPVWFETQAPRGNGIALVMADADADRAAAAVHEALGRELGRGDLAPPRLHRGVTLLTLVAETMGQTVNVAGRFFGALGHRRRERAGGLAGGDLARHLVRGRRPGHTRRRARGARGDEPRARSR
jgi:aspartokinase/homoserine dehydrogenase 1